MSYGNCMDRARVRGHKIGVALTPNFEESRQSRPFPKFQGEF